MNKRSAHKRSFTVPYDFPGSLPNILGKPYDAYVFAYSGSQTVQYLQHEDTRNIRYTWCVHQSRWLARKEPVRCEKKDHVVKFGRVVDHCSWSLAHCTSLLVLSTPIPTTFLSFSRLVSMIFLLYVFEPCLYSFV